jgi:hypothetical protein
MLEKGVREVLKQALCELLFPTSFRLWRREIQRRKMAEYSWHIAASLIRELSYIISLHVAEDLIEQTHRELLAYRLHRNIIETARSKLEAKGEDILSEPCRFG